MTFFTSALTASEASLDGYESVFVSTVGMVARFFSYPLSLTMTTVVTHFTLAVAAQS